MFTNHELRLLRLSRRLNQKQVAEKIGITTQRYSVLENHFCLSPKNINRMLKALSYTKETARKYLDSVPPVH